MATNFKIIDGIKVVKDAKGKIELHVDQSFDGAKLIKWKENNQAALSEFKNQ